MYPIDGVDLEMPYRNSYGDVESESYREYFIYEDGAFLSTYEAKQQFLSDYVSNIASVARNLFLVYPVPETAINIFQRNFQFCDDYKCYMQRDGIPLYLDDDHLSDSGAQMIIKQIQNSYQWMIDKVLTEERLKFETKWNFFNNIRTGVAISVILLLLILLSLR